MSADHGRLHRRKRLLQAPTETPPGSRSISDRDLRFQRLWDRWFRVLFVIFWVVLGVAFVLALGHPGTIDGPLF